MKRGQRNYGISEEVLTQKDLKVEIQLGFVEAG
jgi:hypothetical protein